MDVFSTREMVFEPETVEVELDRCSNSPAVAYTCRGRNVQKDRIGVNGSDRVRTSEKNGASNNASFE